MKRSWLKRGNKQLKRSWIKRKPAKKRKKVIDKKSTNYLRKKLWKLFSEYTRRRDKGQCFTCSAKKPWKQMQAGHFVHKDCLDYDERNINCQCPRCNKWLSGNLIVYAIKLEEMYGYGIVQELKSAGDKIKRWKTKELEDLIKHYEEKIQS